MNRKKFSSKKTFLIFMFTLFVFLFGILLGSTLNSKKVDMVKDLNNDFYFNTLSMEVSSDMLEGNICDSTDIIDSAINLHSVSKKVDYMENTLGTKNQDVRDLKNYYFVLEAKHWLLAKDRYSSCLTDDVLNRSTLLYFYSNDGSCDNCTQQGYVLNYIKREHPGLLLYSFDISYDSAVLDTLKYLYNVTSTPTLVLNEESRSGFVSVEEFLKWANEFEN